MAREEQENLNLTDGKGGKLKTEQLKKNIENIDTASGKIVIENGVTFIKQLRSEAVRQEEVKKAVLVNACTPVEELPVITTDPELDRLADSMEIIEEDDE